MTTIWFDRPNDSRIRAAAFAWRRDQVGQLGDVLPHRLLAQGFTVNGQRVPLVGPQGIWKPKVMEVPLSITTIDKGPYSDTMGPEGLRYRYRGTDPEHPDNQGLRTAWRHRMATLWRMIGHASVSATAAHGRQPTETARDATGVGSCALRPSGTTPQRAMVMASLRKPDEGSRRWAHSRSGPERRTSQAGTYQDRTCATPTCAGPTWKAPTCVGPD